MDRDADFAEFALGQSRGLRTLAYALSGDWHRADDLVQEALERAYVHWGRVTAADDPGAYVRTILIRQVAAEGRRRWRSRERLSSDVPEAPVRVRAEDQADDRIDLGRALLGLSAKQRAILALRYLEDRSVSEVAAVLGITEGTVKRQTYDGVRRMRSLLPEIDQAPLPEVPRA